MKIIQAIRKIFTFCEETEVRETKKHTVEVKRSMPKERCTLPLGSIAEEKTELQKDTEQIKKRLLGLGNEKE